MERRCRRYLWTIGLFAVSGLVAMAALNAWCDPYGVFRGFEDGHPLSAEGGTGSRIGLAERLRQEEYRTVLVGSSRVAWGVNADSPYFGGDKPLNLGLPRANFHESYHVARYALTLGHVRRIYLFLDFFQFTSSAQPAFDFEKSRFSPRFSPIEYYGDQLLGWHATKLSLGLLKDRWKNIAPTVVAQPGNVARQTEAPREAPEPPSRRNLERAPRESFSLHVQHFLESNDLLGRYRYSTERLDWFRELVHRAQDSGVELHVVINPTHCLDLETIRAAGLWETFEQWKHDLAQSVDEANARDVTSTVPLWDFTGYNAYTTEEVPPAESRQSMDFFTDCSHYTTALGDRMIMRITEHPAADPEFGRRIDAESLPAHLTEINLAREAWVEAHLAEESWVIGIAHHSLRRPPVAIAQQPSDVRRR